MPSVLISKIFELIEENVVQWAQECMFDLNDQTKIVSYLHPTLDNLQLKKCLVASGNIDAMSHFVSAIWKCDDEEDMVWSFLNARPESLEFLFHVAPPDSEYVCACLNSQLMYFGRLSVENLQIIDKCVFLSEKAKRALFYVACHQQNTDMLHIQLNVLKWQLSMNLLPISPAIWSILEPHIVNKSVTFSGVSADDIRAMTPFELKMLRTSDALPNPDSLADSRTFYDCFVESMNMHAADFFWESSFIEIVAEQIARAIEALLNENTKDFLYLGYLTNIPGYLLDQVCKHVFETSNNDGEFRQICKEELDLHVSYFKQQPKQCKRLFDCLLSTTKQYAVCWLWPAVESFANEEDYKDIQTKIINGKDLNMILVFWKLAPTLLFPIADQLARIACTTNNHAVWELVCKNRIISTDICRRTASEWWTETTPKSFLHLALCIDVSDCWSYTLELLVRHKQNKQMIDYFEQKKSIFN